MTRSSLLMLETRGDEHNHTTANKATSDNDAAIVTTFMLT